MGLTEFSLYLLQSCVTELVPLQCLIIYYILKLVLSLKDTSVVAYSSENQLLSRSGKTSSLPPGVLAVQLSHDSIYKTKRDEVTSLPLITLQAVCCAAWLFDRHAVIIPLASRPPPSLQSFSRARFQLVRRRLAE